MESYIVNEVRHMPNVVVKWDFEDGTLQGWMIGSPSVSFDSSGALQGTYSLKFSRGFNYAGNYTDLIASTSNVDLSSVSKPILVVLMRDSSENGRNNYPSKLRVVVRDSTNTYVDVSIQTAYNTTNFYRVLVVDLSNAAGKSGLTIELYENSYNGWYDPNNARAAIHYYDNIMILDGADYEYNTGIVASDSEDKTITVSVPSADGDISQISAQKVGMSLMTPDWNYKTVVVTAIHNQGSLSIDSSYESKAPGNTHANYQTPSTAPASFQSISIRATGWSIGAYAGWLEKVAVAFLDNSWNLLRLYVFNIYFTANGVSPRFINAISTVSYGTLTSSSRTFNVKIYGNAFDVALRVKYIYGDRSSVVSGTVKLEVFSSDLATKYGEVTIDITLANDQTTSYITGLPTSTDLVVRMTWTMQANARIVLLAYPLIRVY